MTHVLRIVCIYFVSRLVFPWLHPTPSSTSGTLLFPSPTFSAAETAFLAPCGPSRVFESEWSCRCCWVSWITG